jgi:hypothetical protein
VSSTSNGRPRKVITRTRAQDRPCVDVTELRIQTPRCDIPVLTDAHADALPAPCARFLLGCVRELSSDPQASSLGQHEDVLDLGNPQVCTDPSDVRVPDRPIIVPCDEVGGALFNLLVYTAKRQTLIDVGDLARLQRSYRQHGGKCHTGASRPRRPRGDSEYRPVRARLAL